MLIPPGQLYRREASGVVLFNLLFLVLAIQLMLMTRLDVIRATAGDFFTPSPPTTQHG